jgi:hypothetical protein
VLSTARLTDSSRHKPEDRTGPTFAREPMRSVVINLARAV